MSLGKYRINIRNASWKILRRKKNPKIILALGRTHSPRRWVKHACVTAEKLWVLQRGHAKSFSWLFSCQSAVSSWRVTPGCTTASSRPGQSHTSLCNPCSLVVSVPGSECPVMHQDHFWGHPTSRRPLTWPWPLFCWALSSASLHQ